MRTKTIPSDWLQGEGCRLDVGPYMSGALEAKVVLENLSVKKDRLDDLTAGHSGGIYNGPQFSRTWVNDPAHGVRFVGSGAMLRADLSDLPLLRKKDALSAKLSYLRIAPGMTLISCSGTIGRMVYARPDMEGIWSSQHILKVVPNPDKILSGYLYAYLNSKFGVPLVISGTYGAIIQHIEPRHISGLPVPRLGQSVELKAHRLVDGAASLLSEYTTLIDDATNQLFDESGVWNPSALDWHSDRSDLAFSVNGNALETMRAWNHSRRADRIKKEVTSGASSRLGDIIDLDWLRWRKMFKRIDADPEFGVEVITQKPLFQLVPEGRWVSRNYLLNHSSKYIVPDRTILIAKQGTLGEREVYCRSEYVTGARMLEKAYSDHCMRVVAKPDAIHPGYLFAFLRSEAGFRLLRSLSEGAKQQDLHWRMVPELPIPRCNSGVETEIGDKVDLAYAKRNEAIESLLAAVEFVEGAIEEVA